GHHNSPPWIESETENVCRKGFLYTTHLLMTCQPRVVRHGTRVAPPHRARPLLLPAYRQIERVIGPPGPQNVLKPPSTPMSATVRTPARQISAALNSWGWVQAPIGVCRRGPRPARAPGGGDAARRGRSQPRARCRESRRKLAGQVDVAVAAC